MGDFLLPCLSTGGHVAKKKLQRESAAILLLLVS